MSRIAYLDLIGGVAGDMLLAALIDAGAEASEIFGAMAALPIQHREARVETVTRAGVRALHLTGTPVTGQPSRTLDEILAIVARGGLPEEVTKRAGAVFRRLVAAESRAHGVGEQSIHLHEAGDDDAIFDVVGVLLALRNLRIDEVHSTPVPLGGGRSRQGVAWPGPATLELLCGVPVTGPPPAGETTTPTGAALVTALADSFGGSPAMTLERVGYGAGTRDPSDIPNVLRVLVGETTSPSSVERGTWVVEANIDDLSPQLVADATLALVDAGALDVWVTPIQMKQGRLAVTVSALTRTTALDAVRETFFRTTSTLGVRAYAVERVILDREWDSVQVRGATVRVKRGRMAGDVTTSMPEHADLVRLSASIGVPVRQLWLEAMIAARPDGAPTEEAAEQTTNS